MKAEIKAELLYKLIDQYQSFTKWVLRYIPEIQESQRGKDHLKKIDETEVQIRTSEQNPSQAFTERRSYIQGSSDDPVEIKRMLDHYWAIEKNIDGRPHWWMGLKNNGWCTNIQICEKYITESDAQFDVTEYQLQNVIITDHCDIDNPSSVERLTNDPKMKNGSYIDWGVIDAEKDLYGNLNCANLIDPVSCGRETSCIKCERFKPNIDLSKEQPIEVKTDVKKQLFEMEMCECGHEVPIEFTQFDGDCSTCINCVLEEAVYRLEREKKLTKKLRVKLKDASQFKAEMPTEQTTICADCGRIGGNEATHDCHKNFQPKSIFTKRRERNVKTYDFVVRHKTLIYNTTHHYGNYTKGQNDTKVQELIALARNEIGYSEKTWSGDIFNSLINLYRKICV